MKRIGVLPHTAKPQALAMARELISILEARNVSVWLDNETAELLNRPDLSGEFAGLDAGLVLGGDGAFLREGRRLAEAGVPMLGINFGRLGFLTEIEPEGVNQAIDRLLRGDYRIETRMMLRARVVRNQEVRATYYAINDIVVARGTLARSVHCRLYIDSSFIGVYSGDGMIVATPTGSTAYSLSAGGPILHPSLNALVVTPICPHTLGSRSIVTSPDDGVMIRFDEPDEELLLTVDGQFGERLFPGDEIYFDQAPQQARLIRLEARTFYDVLRSRLARKFSDDFQKEDE